MTDLRKVSTYLFPSDMLPSMSSQELRDYITSRLHIANNMIDGTDPNSPERIDYAQDMIHQARDLLLSRGEIFSDTERESMSFLSWRDTM